ncbi:MAG: hypothetical protein WAU61_05345 [Smithella sp.]
MIFCYRKKLIDKNGASLKPRRVALLLITTAIWLMCTGVSYGYIIINAPMTGSSSSGWVLGGNPNPAILTGGTIDPAGSGWLRLTDSEGNQTGYAYNTTTFDLSQGLLVQFDYATWGGSGADGYSVYLFDSGVSTFNIGAFGGSLGYAQKLSTSTCNPPTATVAGISGGYIGIGVDEYGNFAYGCEGRYLGNSLIANTVTLRGSVVGFGTPSGNIGQTTSTTSYPWIATSANNGSLWYNGTPRPSQTSANYRKVIIQISPAPNPTANVWIQFGYNTTPVQMINGALLPAISTSQSLMVGYAASTGGSTNYHEIRNLLVTNQGTSTAIDLGITKSVVDTTTSSTTTTAVGDTISYTITARNYGPNNITATGVGITDNVPTSITGVTWTCAVVAGSPTGTSCGAASGSGNVLSTTANLPYGGAVAYTVTGIVSAPTTSVISNTASLGIPGSVTDYNSSDDNATASIAVANLATSTKTVTDLTGSNYAAGDTLQYTITLKDNGGFATSGVSVADTIDTTNLTGQTITSCPAGATCSYSAGALSVTGISIPANGSVTIVYTATIVGTDTPGTTINNTATVTNPNGTVVTLVAPVVTVGGTVAGTGNKLLYLYSDTITTGHLNRAHAAVSATTFVEINANTAVSWALSPVLQSAVTITGGAGVTIPVQLYLSTNNTRTYALNPITLTCGATTLGTLTTGTAALTNGAAAALFTFNIPHTTTQTCASGSAITLSITNTNAAGAGHYVYVYPAPATGKYSNVNILSQNVINVGSIGFYSAAYPSAATITSVPPSGTVYIRATISDPFGSYDITGATITITNPSGTVQLSSTSMGTAVYDSGAASKIYQYAYTVPSGAALGNWSISVTATEGTEGTITNTGYASMMVAVPALTVLKSANKASVVPGNIITYTETITNTGAGITTGVVVTDSLSPYVQWGLNSYGTGVAFQFVDGSPASGLTLGTSVYSNNSGSTWIYAPVSAGGGAPAGYDGNVTNWSIPMNGTMNANGANFTINYQVRVK